MMPLFSGSKPAASPSPPSPSPSPSSSASPASSPRTSKKTSKRPPRVYDDAAKCRIKKYESYRQTCSADEKKQEGSCEMVKKCKQHGVGSTIWPVDVWHLDDAQFEAVNEKFKDPSKPNERPVLSGKRCMNEVMRTDAKFVKEIETDCGPMEKKKSERPKSAKGTSKKASAKGTSKKASVKAPAAPPKALAAAPPKALAAAPPKALVKPPAKAASVRPKGASVRPRAVNTNATK